VTLLESGGRADDAATQSLYRGASMAQKYFQLDAARSRYFGGSTNCWMGFCRPLDEDDFEPFSRIVEVLSSPYDEQRGNERYAEPPRPDQIVHETFCGT